MQKLITIAYVCAYPGLPSELQQLVVAGGYEWDNYDMQLDYHHFPADVILRVRLVKSYLIHFCWTFDSNDGVLCYTKSICYKTLTSFASATLGYTSSRLLHACKALWWCSDVCCANGTRIFKRLAIRSETCRLVCKLCQAGQHEANWSSSNNGNVQLRKQQLREARVQLVE
jgi:hypothetical protein